MYNISEVALNSLQYKIKRQRIYFNLPHLAALTLVFPNSKPQLASVHPHNENMTPH